MLELSIATESLRMSDEWQKWRQWYALAGIHVRDHDGKVNWSKLKELLPQSFKFLHYANTDRYRAIESRISPEIAFVGPVRTPTWLHCLVVRDIVELTGARRDTVEAIEHWCTQFMLGSHAHQSATQPRQLCQHDGAVQARRYQLERAQEAAKMARCND